MILISFFYRNFLERISLIRSILRILSLKLKYPNLEIDFKSFIEPNCNIVCTRNSKMKICNCHISNGTSIIVDGGVLEITNSFIGRNVVITAKEKIVISDFCKIAEMVVIRDQNHDWIKKTEFKNFKSAPISIENNVWIANKASVLKGVKIGENSIIAAHALVNKNVQKNSIYGGVPAKKIRDINIKID